MQRLTGKGSSEPKEKIAREVIVPETITIQELANRMAERGVDVIRLLMKQGAMHKITDVIDADTAQLVAEEMGHTVKRVAESDVEEGLFDDADAPEALLTRPPVVTIMGHVDHGKTSLLDAIRKTNVVSGEAGGITQHIGAYQVTSPSGGKVAFVDTPGHAAFTAMRARGAQVTDIVVLVVAADDGVMPQTIEAIKPCQGGRCPARGGDQQDRQARGRSPACPNGTVAARYPGRIHGRRYPRIRGFRQDPRRAWRSARRFAAAGRDPRSQGQSGSPPAEGTVIEAKLDRGRGPVATVLVQRGTLKTGDIVVAGAEWGRVRALINDKGEKVDEAGPSMPAEILGFNGTPEAGDRVCGRRERGSCPRSHGVPVTPQA